MHDGPHSTPSRRPRLWIRRRIAVVHRRRPLAHEARALRADSGSSGGRRRSALAAGAAFAPANDNIARRCDGARRAAVRPAVQRPRVAPGAVDIGEALLVCAQAAEAPPVLAPLPVSLRLKAAAGGRLRGSSPAAHRSTSSWQCLGALALGVLSLNGSDVSQNDERAASVFREAADAGLALADDKLGPFFLVERLANGNAG